MGDDAAAAAQVGQFRQPRIAELVARALRRRIVTGDLPDGAMLPKQEDLLREFGVSKPSLREALRILETEGLVTVRRGNTGGATVHVPRAANVAYTLSLVLQSRLVTLADVGKALKQMEPACAALCAERDDRAETVLPLLREAHDQAVAARDPVDLTTFSRRFHEILVQCCGNETMILVVGSLESLWSAHQEDWARSPASTAAFTDKAPSLSSRQAHGGIIELVAQGDAAGVAHEVRRHLEESVFYAEAATRFETIETDALKAHQDRGIIGRSRW